MKRVLIANRGEIALRILQACRELGLETVAAHSRADRQLRHLSLADDSVCIGASSYMDAGEMVSAAVSRRCDSVHPGYGFLAEDADFARQVTEAGLKFVGPDARHILLMGNKANARQAMMSEGVPVLPGSDGEIQDAETAVQVAQEIGFPVMVKASLGGGGRGIEVATDEHKLRNLFKKLTAQAETLFGDPGIYIERWLQSPRHIEIQVFGDGKGGVLHFGARDCSIQRRHQKLLEESPPPGIAEGQINELAQVCCRALAKLKYENAGTLEFLYQDGEFYFIEMNTRIQVEHPITESVCSVDLVKLQLAFAGTGKLDLSQEDIEFNGHAIECRINAEDSEHHPAPGPVDSYSPPGGPGARTDSHLYSGYQVPHQYDSLLAKIIASGADRDEALARMARALAELEIGPVATNVDLHRRIIRSDAFRRGRISTSFLEVADL